MKKVLRFLLSICLILSTTSCEIENPDKEDSIQSLWGSYKLTSIRWPGLPVDLNDDDISSWDLLKELQNKLGYYEPDYMAIVKDGITISPAKEWAENATAFNITIPYPYFVVDNDGKWVCTQTCKLSFSLRATEETFVLNSNCCQVYPGFNDSTDLFLSKVKEISLFVESFNDHKFEIGIHCTLPCNSSGEQNLNENYLYYEFTK